MSAGPELKRAAEHMRFRAGAAKPCDRAGRALLRGFNHLLNIDPGSAWRVMQIIFLSLCQHHQFAGTQDALRCLLGHPKAADPFLDMTILGF